MKERELSYIEINGVNYPLYCDLNALELIQDKYTYISDFERDLIGITPLRLDNGEPQRNENGEILSTRGEPKIKAIVDALYIMASEGRRIAARQTGEEQPELTMTEIREACNIPFTELSNILHDCFNRSFNVKKKSNETKTRRSRKKNI